MNHKLIFSQLLLSFLVLFSGISHAEEDTSAAVGYQQFSEVSEVESYSPELPEGVQEVRNLVVVDVNDPEKVKPWLPFLKRVEKPVLVGGLEEAYQNTVGFTRSTVDFYRNKVHLTLLTVYSGIYAFNWFILSDSSPEMDLMFAQKFSLWAFAFLSTATLGVAAHNWELVLNKGKEHVQVILRQASYTKGKAFDAGSDLVTNFLFYGTVGLVYDAIININDLSAFLGPDLWIGLSAASFITMFSSGVWDPVIKSWGERMGWDDKGKRPFYWARNFVIAMFFTMDAAGAKIMSISGQDGLLTIGAIGAFVLGREILMKPNSCRAAVK